MSSSTVYKGMSSDQEAIFRRATASNYIKFDEGTVDVLFENGKVSVAAGIGNKESYEFDVILTTGDEKEAKILGTQSKGLMEKLLSFYPLVGKQLSITRVGEGYQTLYEVEEI